MHPFINIAVNAARRAGKIMLQASQRLDKLQVVEKTSAQDLVTNIDHVVEADIIETINRAYPRHCIVAEETGTITNSDTEIVWIIDPIAGTNNFVHGFPHYCVAIAVQRKGIVEHGVIYDPNRDELFIASKGEGAQLNGQRIRVSGGDNLKQALLAANFMYHPVEPGTEEFLTNYNKLLTISAIWRSGSAALDLAYVAAGRLDGFFAMNLKLWDIAAGSILIREAGGFISDFSAKEGQFLTTGKMLAGNIKIYHELITQLPGYIE